MPPRDTFMDDKAVNEVAKSANVEENVVLAALVPQETNKTKATTFNIMVLTDAEKHAQDLVPLSVF